MAKKENRFKVVFKDGSQLSDDGVRQVLVDSSLPRSCLTLHQLLQREACQTTEDYIAEGTQIGNAILIK